jgi:hypothetical protein
MPQESFAPPRAAVWLVDLFACDEIRGDLIEECSEVASKCGHAHARRWYWRQCLKTVARLIGDAYCHAPWVIAGSVLLAGIVGICGMWVIRRAVFPVLIRYCFTHFKLSNTIIFLPMYEILIQSVIVPALIGWVAAKIARERGMVAALTLTLLLAARVFAVFPWQLYLHPHRFLPNPINHPMVFWPTLAFTFVSPIAIAAGGAIGRKLRPSLAHS